MVEMVQGVPFKSVGKVSESGGGSEADQSLCIQRPEEDGRWAECLQWHRGQNWDTWRRPEQARRACVNAISSASSALSEKIGKKT
jgi:hypothetical protein